MRPYHTVVGTVVLVAFGAGLGHYAEAEHHPHTLGNTFGIVYTSTGFGMSAHPLVMSEVVEFLRDVVKPNAPTNPVTFNLA